MQDSEVGQLWKWSLCKCSKMRVGHGVARRLVCKIVDDRADLIYTVDEVMRVRGRDKCQEQACRELGILHDEFMKESVE